MAKHGPIVAVLCSAFCCIGLAQGANGPSLYSRLGGADGMNAVVSEAIEHTVEDAAARRQLASYICARAGGGCSQSPAPQISDAQFVQLMEVLRASMRAHDVPLSARNELLEAIAPLRRGP